MIVGVCLCIMLVITLFSVVMGNSFIGNVVDTVIDGSSIVNGSTSTFTLDDASSSFYIDSLQGAIVIIGVIIILAGLIGIRIIGSGLSDSSIKIITLATSYGGIWTLLSALAFPLIIQIATFGSLIYIGITIVYVIGVVQKGIGGGGGSDFP